MDKFRVIAKKFIEYLKNEDFDTPFQFEMNDKYSIIWFGTKVVRDFDNYIFVTSDYGGASNGLVTSFMIEEFDTDDIDEYYEDILEKITEYYYNGYKEFTPII